MPGSKKNLFSPIELRSLVRSLNLRELELFTLYTEHLSDPAFGCSIPKLIKLVNQEGGLKFIEFLSMNAEYFSKCSIEPKDALKIAASSKAAERIKALETYYELLINNNIDKSLI